MRILKRLGTRPVQFGGEAHSGWLPKGVAQPLPTPIKTVELSFAILEDAPGSYVLEWRGPSSEFSGDTWHSSVVDAMAEAEQAFGVAPHEWRAGDETSG